MKQRRRKLWIIEFIVLALVITGCDISNLDEPKFSKEIDFATLTAEGWEISQGSIYLSKGAEEGIYKGQVLVLANDPGSSEIRVNQIYILQQREGEAVPSEKIENAVVLYRGGKLIVYNTASKEAYSLNIQYSENVRPDGELRQRTRDVLAKANVDIGMDQISLSTGYGLSRSVTSEGEEMVIDRGQMEEVLKTNLSLLGVVFPETDFTESANKSMAECSAGGPNSLHCSVGGCSGEPSNCQVRCTDGGEYACCNCGPLGGSGIGAASCVCVPG